MVHAKLNFILILIGFYDNYSGFLLVYSEDATCEEEVLFPFSRLCWFDYVEGTILTCIWCCFSAHFLKSCVLFIYDFLSMTMTFVNVSNILLPGTIIGPTSFTNQVWQCWWRGENHCFPFSLYFVCILHVPLICLH